MVLAMWWIFKKLHIGSCGKPFRRFSKWTVNGFKPYIEMVVYSDSININLHESMNWNIDPAFLHFFPFRSSIFIGEIILGSEDYPFYVSHIIHIPFQETWSTCTMAARICFLDFGLMDRVSPRVMEGFADGIRSVVSQNWTALAQSMQQVEFVPDPVKRSLELMETPRKYTVYHSIYVCIYDICIYNYSMLLQMF